MMLRALRSRKHKAPFAVGAVVVVAAVLGASSSRAQAVQAPAAPAAVADAPEAAVQPGPNPFAARFPDMVLRTHEGKNVRFYDDLLKGKIVMINFMYATCKQR